MRKFFLLALGCGALQVMAQRPLSVLDAVNLALKQNYNIQIAKSNIDIAKVNNNIGIAGGLPTVTGTATNQESIVNINQKINSATGDRDLTRNGAISNNLNAGVAGSMLLYNGYRVIATKKQLEAIEAQSESLFNSQVQNTIAAVMTKYFDVVRQNSYLTTLSKSIDVSKKQLEIINAKRSVGYANDADLFQAEIDLHSKEQDFQSQKIVVEQTKADLLNLLSLTADSTIVLTDSIAIENNIKFDDILTRLQQNPDIIAASQQITINELAEKQTAALRYPSLRLNGGINYGRSTSNGGQILLNQQYGPYVGLNLSVPIYNGSVLKRQQQTAAINTQISKTQKEATILNYQTDLAKTYQMYIHTLDLIAAQYAINRLSEQLVNLTLQRFSLSQATILEVRAAQQSFEEAGYKLVNLSYAAKAAEIELKRVAGTIAP
ncbi:TolC family protein [Hydrotalea sandarakina]|jgi:outer membrane protein TolC|uniref:Outer membrane protein TolC n=1 Tax=Hydrotalea sandarakina TaxID=1004304 RepID=A0A2W7RWC1_9BACT|nr:TolC family protein [Hydrotalea sandarakina]PZX62790.1 outer membrane protein TolC [Hydrotalea sandarakina]